MYFPTCADTRSGDVIESLQRRVHRLTIYPEYLPDAAAERTFWSGPVTDHSWRTRAPITQGFGVTSPTAPAPIARVFEPRALVVAVGKVTEGPTPQIKPFAAAGEK